MGHLRNRYLLLSDAVLVAITAWLAYALRFEGMVWGQVHSDVAVIYAAVVLPLWLGVLIAGGMYRRLWRSASVRELRWILTSALGASALSAVIGIWGLTWLGIAPNRVPMSVLFMHGCMATACVAAPRFLTRMLAGRGQRRRRTDDRRALIVGAGAAGQMIARELIGHPQLGQIPIGFVDDDVRKHGLRVHDLPVFGPLDRLAHLCRAHEIGEIVIAMPSAPGAVIREVVRVARELRLPTRTVPGLFEILSGRVRVGALREVRIEDLLRREPIRTELEGARSLALGRTVLVTGAGGSIGSELCRQIAQLRPGELVMLGHAENEIFEIQQELSELHPALPLTPVIADVRDTMRIRSMMLQHRPHAVFHAAAHKHVPLMEGNVVEAITNNVLGTRNVVDGAVAAGTPHFVLISTDKAVRPTSIMGASKRAAELVVQRAGAVHDRHFVSVRFGNVLGSRGSVVPTFLRQIRAGGPVTVTHPEMRRFFMTIPEAVQLVLQAAALGRGGEVFVLDMGDPVRVVDLAADLIRLSGLEVGTDIELRFTGTRPGEKLYEEMFFDEENAVRTIHPKVLRAKNAAPPDHADELLEVLLAAAERDADETELRSALAALAPEGSVFSVQDSGFGSAASGTVRDLPAPTTTTRLAAD